MEFVLIKLCILIVIFEHILIKLQVVPDGIAHKCGKLRMGDRILKVNDVDISRATHQEAVMELLKPGDDIKLTIQHDPLPPGFQVSLNTEKKTNIFRCFSKIA